MAARVVLLVTLAATAAFAGCGAGRGSSSPSQAVTDFLEPWADPHLLNAGDEQERRKAISDLWASRCDHVDPRIRPALRFYDKNREVDARANCGAAVSVLVAYTGDTGEVTAPEKIAGRPVSEATRGDSSIVTVAMDYGSLHAGDARRPPPPTRARIKVLVVRHDGGWWVATPEAFNPLEAVHGGLSERQLRADYRKLLAAARG